MELSPINLLFVPSPNTQILAAKDQTRMEMDFNFFKFIAMVLETC